MDRPIGPLRRLSGALLGRARDTDWWMVAVEIAIVVLGILIAFQVDRWGDRLRERQDERQLLHRVVAEARASIAAIDFIRSGHRDSARNFRLLADAAGDPAAPARYAAQARDGCNLLRLPAVQRPASATIAQAAGPRIEIISDPQLRRSLTDAVAAREFGDTQLAFFRSNFLEYGRVIEPHMRWQFTGPGEETRCAVDIPGLVADQAAMALLPKLARDHLRLADYRTAERDALARVAERATCFLARTCPAQ